jgi:ferritin-like metal-binding protein YciE
MDQDNLRELFIENIQDLYDAEKRLTKALPKIAKAANSDELAEAIRTHLSETQQHVTRLEDVFKLMGAPAKAKTCKAMRGLLEEGDEVIQEHSHDGVISDLAIIAAAQKVEHYELSGYGTVRTIAERLGQTKVAKLLQQTEDEEAHADETLTQIAMSLYDSAGEEEEEAVGISSRTGGNGRAKNSTKRTTR